MKRNIEKWVDTHVHIGDIEKNGLVDMVEGLKEVFAGEETDLRFIASPDCCSEEVIPMMIENRNGGIIRAHELLNQAVKHLPGKLYGSCMVNPNFMDDSLKLMELCFEKWGFIQLGEFVTYMMNYKMNDTSTVEIVKKGIFEYRVPIHVHVSTSNAKPQGHYESGEEELEDLLNLMERLSEGKYIFTHGVGAPLIHPPVIDTYLKIIDRRYGKWPENLWIEIMHFHAEGVKSILGYAPSNRILAGMDWENRGTLPFPKYGTIFGPAEKENPYPVAIESLISFLYKAGADDAMIENIAWKNAFELYGVDGREM